jgi:adenine-specific DNA-methyltransferase
VIFISIDDNEHAQLKVLCDEIFGNDNFLIDFIWNKKNVVQNDAKFASVNHEYVLSFRKSNQREKFNLLSRTDEANARYDNPDNDPR